MATAYATKEDLEEIGLPKQALAGLSTKTIDRHLQAASGRVDSYMRSQEKLPLATPYPMEIVEATVILASYSLLIRRGYNPDNPSDANFRERYLDMVGNGDSPGWLDKLASGHVNLSAAADATIEREGRPRFSTSKPRGWDEPSTGTYERI